MTLEQRIRAAEAELFAGVGAEPEASFRELARTGLRVRVLSHGRGAPVVLLHGVSLGAAAWAPLLPLLPGHRLLAVDLPGHGLSNPVRYRRGEVRAHACDLIDDVFDALGLDEAPVIGHSLGGMFALWHAAARPGRISRLRAVAGAGPRPRRGRRRA
jgi:pimeloyl-ACP methyl ester carboxylesterase